jgi:hypothetical protein
VDDLTSGLSHTYAGPEVTFTKVLGGLSFGYLKDFGWVDGQSAWGQVAWMPVPSTRLTGRLSWFQTTEDLYGTSSVSASNELGVTINATVGLTSWLSLRASVLVRAGLESGDSSMPFGTATNLFFVGTY